ncbi:MAG: hypothetical protein ACJ75I_05560, partial [Solirubrobacterales bacterium]
ANSTEIKVKPGTKTFDQPADSLRTALLDFKLADNVKRVEFEFDPPDDGYFWGLTAPQDSRRFRKNDSVTFCVRGGDQGELEWPGHFPVTFTNGSLSTGQIKGRIVIHAQRDAEQCHSPVPDNRACKLLSSAHVGELLGSGLYPYSNQSRDSDGTIWICFYHGSSGEVDLNLARAANRTAKQVREGVRRQIEQLGLQRLDVGDVGGIGTFSDGKKNYSLVVFAVGKENALFTLGPGAQRDTATKLAKRLAGELD